MEVITVGNNKGGVGKTMQCYQLICHLANKGNKVLAIDLDSQANLSSTLGVQIQRTLIPEWLIGDVPFQDLVISSEGEGDFHNRCPCLMRLDGFIPRAARFHSVSVRSICNAVPLW